MTDDLVLIDLTGVSLRVHDEGHDASPLGLLQKVQRESLLFALEQEANRKHLDGLLELVWLGCLDALCLGGQL